MFNQVDMNRAKLNRMESNSNSSSSRFVKKNAKVFKYDFNRIEYTRIHK